MSCLHRQRRSVGFLWRRTGGQASLEVLAFIPAILLVGVICFQILAVGYAAVLADHASEAAALASAVDGDPISAAKRSVPGWSRQRIRTVSRRDVVTVTVKPLSPLRSLAERLEISASATVLKPVGSRWGR